MADPQALTILIPAYNEEHTVGEVVKAALQAGLGEVWVISDGSNDATARTAHKAGAKVLELSPNQGKAAAMLAGAQQTGAEYLMFLDADLVGLQPHHLQALWQPVASGTSRASVGLFTGGRASTTLASWLTRHWSGQRVVPRATLLQIPGLTHLRYAVEVAITQQLRRQNIPIHYVRLPGVSQLMKEEKLGFWKGLWARLRMFGQIVRFYRGQGAEDRGQ